MPPVSTEATEGTSLRFSRMRSDSEGLLGGAARRLRNAGSRLAALPFRAPSLLDRSNAAFSGIKRFGISKVEHYWKDPFHTLLNLPWPRFIAIFFLVYVCEFMIFALLFWAQSNRCIIGMDSKFAHALWMSSRTASTLGFDAIHPNPECVGTNLTVMLQVIASSLVNFIMLGLVFARFSAPFKRASTIRFSSVMVCNRHPSGCWAISLRVANIRKHQILKPCLRMVMTAVDSITPSNYIFEHLAIEGLATQETNLELGFPANILHVITPSSPLYNLSLLEMDTRMMEILVFVDGIDAMTSKNMSARRAYNTNEIHMNEQFLPLHLEMRGKALGLDFTSFDQTALASTQLLAEYNADPALADRPLPEVQSHMWHLRHNTFKRLTERDAALGHGPQQSRGNGVAPANTTTAAPPPGTTHTAGGGAGPSAGVHLLPGSSGSSFTGNAHAQAHGHAHVSSNANAHRPNHGSASMGTTPTRAAAVGNANPFAVDPGVGGAGTGAGGGGGGAGSSWLGFGVSPTAGATSIPMPVNPMPLSSFLNATGGHTGLESFADKPAPHGYSTGHRGPGGSGGGAGGAGVGPSGHSQLPLLSHGGATSSAGGGGGAGGGVFTIGSAGGSGGVEMLPTSMPASDAHRGNSYAGA